MRPLSGPGPAGPNSSWLCPALDDATTEALELVKATGYQAVGIEVMTCDDYDRRIDSLAS